jgi:hypothetical protein
MTCNGLQTCGRCVFTLQPAAISHISPLAFLRFLTTALHLTKRQADTDYLLKPHHTRVVQARSNIFKIAKCRFLRSIRSIYLKLVAQSVRRAKKSYLPRDLRSILEAGMVEP